MKCEEGFLSRSIGTHDDSGRNELEWPLEQMYAYATHIARDQEVNSVRAFPHPGHKTGLRPSMPDGPRPPARGSGGAWWSSCRTSRRSSAHLFRKEKGSSVQRCGVCPFRDKSNLLVPTRAVRRALVIKQKAVGPHPPGQYGGHLLLNSRLLLIATSLNTRNLKVSIIRENIHA